MAGMLGRTGRKGQSERRRGLLQLRVFRLGFIQEEHVGIGVFPERHEQTEREPSVGLSTLLSVALEELLEARLRAQRGEIWAGIDGCEIAVSKIESFL